MNEEGKKKTRIYKRKKKKSERRRRRKEIPITKEKREMKKEKNG